MMPENQVQLEPKKSDIPGLIFLHSFISKEEENYLISQIKLEEWNLSLKRRTQHYGYEYSYDRKSVATPTKPIPAWCQPIQKKLQEWINSNKEYLKIDANASIQFDQLIINQYEPGQGINPHVDNTALFTDIIVSLSLSSDCVMKFEKVDKKRSREKYENKEQEQNERVHEYKLRRRCLTIMMGQGRYEWKHSIAGRKKDNGRQRSVRYSLTFRKMRKQALE